MDLVPNTKVLLFCDVELTALHITTYLNIFEHVYRIYLNLCDWFMIMQMTSNDPVLAQLTALRSKATWVAVACDGRIPESHLQRVQSRRLIERKHVSTFGQNLSEVQLA